MHMCHPAMQTYLADLEARNGVVIRYQRWSSRYQDKAPFRHEVELLGPYSGLPSPFQVPYKGEVRTIEVAHSQPPTGIGERVELVQGENLYQVAAVDGRRITLAFDLERLFEAPQGDLQPGLLLEAVLGDAVPKAVLAIKNYAWVDEAARFTTWNVQGVDDQIAVWRGNVRDNDYELDRLTAVTAGLVRKNGELKESMKAASACTRQEREAKAQEEWAGLVRMVPNPVQAVDLDYGKLTVVLKPMTIEDDSYEYQLGTFTLHISTDNVRIYSDTGKRYPHPHVSSDGIPCWGNLGPNIAKLLGERQYASLVSVILLFLHSYNEKDAYRRLETWDPDYNEDE